MIDAVRRTINAMEPIRAAFVTGSCLVSDGGYLL